MSKRSDRLYGTPRGPQPAPISQTVARLLNNAPRPRDRIEDDKGLAPVVAPIEALDVALAELAASLPPAEPEPDVAREGIIIMRSGNQYVIVAIPYVDGVTPVRVLDRVKSSSGVVAIGAVTRRFQQNVAHLGFLKASHPGETGVPFLPRAKADRRAATVAHDGPERRVGEERRVAESHGETTGTVALTPSMTVA